MPEEVYGLTKQQLGRVVRMLRDFELAPREDLPNRQIPQRPHGIDHLAGTAEGAVTARAGAVPGTGYVQAKKFTTGTAADYADPVSNLVPVLNFSTAVIPSGEYVVAHRHRESGKWAVGFTAPEIVSLQSATGDTTLTGSLATMPLGDGAPVLPTWLTLNGSSELVVGSAAYGRYLRFGGAIGVKRNGSATTSNSAEVVIQGYTPLFGGSMGIVLWQERFYVANDVDDERGTRCPSFTYGPLESGDKFRIQARQLSGSDTMQFIGGVTEYRLDLELLPLCAAYGVRQQP